MTARPSSGGPCSADGGAALDSLVTIGEGGGTLCFRRDGSVSLVPADGASPVPLGRDGPVAAVAVGDSLLVAVTHVPAWLGERTEGEVFHGMVAVALVMTAIGAWVSRRGPAPKAVRQRRAWGWLVPALAIATAAPLLIDPVARWLRGRQADVVEVVHLRDGRVVATHRWPRAPWAGLRFPIECAVLRDDRRLLVAPAASIAFGDVMADVFDLDAARPERSVMRGRMACGSPPLRA